MTSAAGLRPFGNIRRRGSRRRSLASCPRRFSLRPNRSAPATSVPGRATAWAAAFATGLTRRVVNGLAERARVCSPNASRHDGSTAIAASA